MICKEYIYYKNETNTSIYDNEMFHFYDANSS